MADRKMEVFFGKKDEPSVKLVESPNLIAVSTHSKRSVRSAGPVATPSLGDGELVASFPDSGVEVYRVPVDESSRSLHSRKSVLRENSDVRFAGGVLVQDGTDEPMIYSENLFTKFIDSADPAECAQVLHDAGLSIKKAVTYADNAFIVSSPQGTGKKVFDIAAGLLRRDDVEYCHPEIIRKRDHKGISPKQWHLKKTRINGHVVDASASVDGAHLVTRGERVRIAIIDDGVDIDHIELRAKVEAPRDMASLTADPRPRYSGDNHGTACAGVACGRGVDQASGVAPAATLIPIRNSSDLGSESEAEAFQWAVDNKADIISCSWGPVDGQWWNPDDPRHKLYAPMPASTRLAINYAVTKGRAGKGCVVLFAAGNGNESVDLDGYASHPQVIAVAACNDRGLRSVYSDYGKAVFCAFPSSDFGELGHQQPLTPGIWTTDRTGRAGYNRGSVTQGDARGNYTNSFGGTSSSCPGAAGVVALMLSVNPDLKYTEVKDLLRQSCDKIDIINGQYDANGHSPFYGYGRLNAARAVNLAKAREDSPSRRRRVEPTPLHEHPTVLVVRTEFKVPLAARESFLHALNDLEQATRSNDGCISITTTEDATEGMVIVSELWQSEQALQNHIYGQTYAAFKSHLVILNVEQQATSCEIPSAWLRAQHE